MTPSNLDLARECGADYVTGRLGDKRHVVGVGFTTSQLDAFAERIRAEKQPTPDAPEPSGEREKIIKELRQAHAGHTDEGPSTFSDAADMLAADAPQAREPSGEHLSDALSRSMHVLEAVDVYHERPDRMNRTALRIVIMDEFEAALLAARSEP